MEKLNKQELGQLANCTPNHTQSFTGTWDKINEIVDWINTFETLFKVNLEGKVDGVCQNCNFYHSTADNDYCSYDLKRIKLCLTNDYKLFRAK